MALNEVVINRKQISGDCQVLQLWERADTFFSASCCAGDSEHTDENLLKTFGLEIAIV
jgi:hypothetical protein